MKVQLSNHGCHSYVGQTQYICCFSDLSWKHLKGSRGIKYKIKGKTGKHCTKMKKIEKNSHLKTNYFTFLRFFLTF